MKTHPILFGILLVSVICMQATSAQELRPPNHGAPPNLHLEAGDIRVHIAGRSGKLIFWNDNATSSPRKFMVEVNKLYETNPDGRRLGRERFFPTFANQDFSFSDLKDVVYEGDDGTTLTAKNINFNALLNVDGSPTTLTIMNYLFCSTGTIVVDENAYDVEEGDLKFNVRIDGWPFEDEDNRLVLEMAVKTPGLRPDCDRDDDEIDLHDGGFLILAQTAHADLTPTSPTGVMVDVATTITQHGSVGRIYYNFPYFEHNIVYDPLLLDRPEKDMSIDDIRVRLAGRSGKIKFWNDRQDSEGGKMFMIEHNKLYETTADGDRLKDRTFNNFASQDFEFSPFREVVYEGDAGTTLPAKNIDFTAHLEVDGQPTTLTVMTYLFCTTGTIVVDGEPLDVDRGHLKFDIAIDEWPFTTDTNMLVFEMAIKTPGTTPTLTGNALDLGDEGHLVLAETALFDDEPSTFSTRVDVDGSVARIYFTFHHFDNAVHYDPVMYSTFKPKADVGRSWLIYE